jgi:pimeloyl-ACP methyl ester carboxylesterase
MRIKKQIQLMLIFTAIFILLSNISFGQIDTKNKNQTKDSVKTIKTKIDVGGYSLFVNIYGEGSPTVIFESGSGAYSIHWNLVQPEISKITRTFSYDRAGLGKSNKRNLPNTTLTQIQELHTLLKNTEVKKPYIFVVSSYGAYIARLYTNMYPDEVVGVVFADGTHENFSDYLEKSLTPDQLENFKKWVITSPDGTYEEMLLSTQQVKEAGKQDAFRKKPVIVLTSDYQIMEKEYADKPNFGAISHWAELQKDLIATSDKSKQYIIKGSGHMIPMDKPQIVINAIKKMIDYDLKSRQLPIYKTVKISSEKLKKFAGKYLYDVNVIMTVKEENGHLFADIPYLLQTEMYPISEIEIITKDMEVAATILRLTELGIVIKNIYSAEEKNTIKVADDYLTPNECLASGKIDEALNKYKEVKKFDPENAAISEDRLNDLGYDMLNRSKINEAIVVFKLNVDFYPQSWNVYDSYAEALIKAGNKELSIENYEKSLELNPKNTNATEQLKILKEK